MLQRWRGVGSTVYDLTDRRVEPQAPRSVDKRVTARSTGNTAPSKEMLKRWRAVVIIEFI